MHIGVISTLSHLDLLTRPVTTKGKLNIDSLRRFCVQNVRNKFFFKKSWSTTRNASGNYWRQFCFALLSRTIRIFSCLKSFTSIVSKHLKNSEIWITKPSYKVKVIVASIVTLPSKYLKNYFSADKLLQCRQTTSVQTH